MAIQTLPIQSSAFWSVEWDDDTLDLFVVFDGARGAPRYTYPGVGEDLIKDWMNAASQGSYFHKYIKPLASSTIRNVRKRLPRKAQIDAALQLAAELK